MDLERKQKIKQSYEKHEQDKYKEIINCSKSNMKNKCLFSEYGALVCHEHIKKYYPDTKGGLGIMGHFFNKALEELKENDGN